MLNTLAFQLQLTKVGQYQNGFTCWGSECYRGSCCCVHMCTCASIDRMLWEIGAGIPNNSTFSLGNVLWIGVMISKLWRLFWRSMALSCGTIKGVTPVSVTLLLCRKNWIAGIRELLYWRSYFLHCSVVCCASQIGGKQRRLRRCSAVWMSLPRSAIMDLGEETARRDLV